MKKIFYIFLVCFVGRVQAQTTPSDIRLHALTSGADKVNTGAAISGIKVIQHFSVEEPLGYVPAAKGNETFQLVVGNGRRWLDTLVTNRYAATFAGAGNPLIWAFHDCTVTQDSANQFNFLHCAVDVYAKGRVTEYRKIFSIDTVLTGDAVDSNASMVLLTGLLDNIYARSGSFIQQNLSLVNGVNQSAAVLAATKSEEGISNLVTGASAIPILKDSILKDGAYQQFTEFVANAPSITGRIGIAPDTAAGYGKFKIFQLNADSSTTLLPSLWGICIGGELYKVQEGLLIPLERVGNSVILARYQDPVKRRNQAMYWRMFADYGWPNNANPYDRTKIYTVTGDINTPTVSNGLKPVATRINLTTGQLAF